MLQDTPKSRVTGVIIFNVAIMCLCMSDAMLKNLGATYNFPTIILFRAGLGLIPIMAFVILQGRLKEAKETSVLSHLPRSVLIFASLFCLIYAIPKMELATFYAIEYSIPIFATIMAMALLKEQVGPRRWAAIIVSFLGVTYILNPTGGEVNHALLVEIIGCVLFSSYVVLMRKDSVRHSGAVMTLYMHLFMILFAILLAPWFFEMPAQEHWIFLLGVGLMGGTGQTLVAVALKYAPVSLTVIFQYTSLLWGALYGYMFWAEIPDYQALIGGVIIMASGLYITYREQKISAATEQAT